MTTLKKRAWSLTIGTLRITPSDRNRELTVQFEVHKSVKREPNTATVKVANLHKDHRDSIATLDQPTIEIRAGYVDLEDTIFVGDARDAWSVVEETEIWTTVEAEDGGRSYRSASIERSYSGSTPLRTVLTDCADAMGVGIGNISSVTSGATLDESGRSFADGTVLSGPAWRQLDRICQSASLRWSVQNGVLQFREAGRPATTRAIKLSPTSGLVGSPTRGRRDERTRKVTHSVRSLIVPGLYPGRVVEIESGELNGDYMIKRVGFFGDTRGNEWYADLECQEYDHG